MNISNKLENIIQEEYSCLIEIAGKTGNPNRPELGYKALKSVLHAIRDLLLFHEVFHFSGRLPVFIRGIYFEGYNPENIPITMYNQDLLKKLRERMGPGNSVYFENYLQKSLPGQIDKEDFLHKIRENTGCDMRIQPQDALQAVIEILHTRLTAGEMNEIKHFMQNSVRELMA